MYIYIITNKVPDVFAYSIAALLPSVAVQHLSFPAPRHIPPPCTGCKQNGTEPMQAVNGRPLVDPKDAKLLSFMMADPEQFRSNFFAPSGADAFQWWIGSNQILFQWKIERAVAAEIASSSKKSCSPEKVCWNSQGGGGLVTVCIHSTSRSESPWHPLRQTAMSSHSGKVQGDR